MNTSDSFELRKENRQVIRCQDITSNYKFSNEIFDKKLTYRNSLGVQSINVDHFMCWLTQNCGYVLYCS